MITRGEVEEELRDRVRARLRPPGHRERIRWLWSVLGWMDRHGRDVYP